ncbi:MAG: metallophosphoesterase [Lachnospiraceae bacterium]|nr:metallophosphoesterase [Lachnospiraceae bacterium]
MDAVIIKDKRKIMTVKEKKPIIVLAVIILILGVSALLVLFKIPQKAIEKIRTHSDKEVTVYEEKTDIEGLEEPFTIFFIADAHICLCDDRDAEVKDICESRYKEFERFSMGSEKNFSIVMDYVRKENPDLVIFGGDIADEATYASIEYIEKEIGKLKCPYLFLMGNHDFAYGSEYFSDKAYEDYFTRYDALNEVKEGCQIKEYDDFAILLLDDQNNQVCDETADAIQKLDETGKEVIIAEHVPILPLYEETDIVERTNEVWGGDEYGNSRVLMGDEAVYPKGATRNLIGFASRDDGPVRLLLAGHIHFYHRDKINENAVQVTAKPAFERGIVKVTLY